MFEKNKKYKNGVYTTTNDKNEYVIVKITNEVIQIQTYQKNNFVRFNVYHKKEGIKEEYFE